MPSSTNKLGSAWVLGRPMAPSHLTARWLSRPQGAPSGVCTGHKKPECQQKSGEARYCRSAAQGSRTVEKKISETLFLSSSYIPKPSGSNLRTDVVFISEKKAPRWTERKCDRYLHNDQELISSTTMDREEEDEEVARRILVDCE